MNNDILRLARLALNLLSKYEEAREEVIGERYTDPTEGLKQLKHEVQLQLKILHEVLGPHVALLPVNGAYVGFKMHYDSSVNIIHVLDLDVGVTVTNAAELVYEWALAHWSSKTSQHVIRPVRVFFYHTDGIVSEFNPNTKFAPAPLHLLDPTFEKICRERGVPKEWPNL